MLCVPLFAAGDRNGALNLYAQGAEAFSQEDRAVAEALAERSALAAAAVEHSHQLELALASRTMTGQATGLLMATLRVDGNRAFAFLVRMSNERNVKLVDIAERLIARHDSGESLME